MSSLAPFKLPSPLYWFKRGFWKVPPQSWLNQGSDFRELVLLSVPQLCDTSPAAVWGLSGVGVLLGLFVSDNEAVWVCSRRPGVRTPQTCRLLGGLLNTGGGGASSAGLIRVFGFYLVRVCFCCFVYR